MKAMTSIYLFRRQMIQGNEICFILEIAPNMGAIASRVVWGCIL